MTVASRHTRLSGSRRRHRRFLDVSRETLTSKSVASVHRGSTMRRLRTMCGRTCGAATDRFAPVVRPRHPFGRQGMASDDALAPGQSQGRKRWFGGRGSTRPTEQQGVESDMGPAEPPSKEMSVQTETAPDLQEADDIRVEPEMDLGPTLPAPAPE